MQNDMKKYESIKWNRRAFSLASEAKIDFQATSSLCSWVLIWPSSSMLLEHLAQASGT